MAEEVEESSSDKVFIAEIAKLGRATCKHCKQKCEKGVIRLAKLAPNPFGAGQMKIWYHLDCIFQVFIKQRVTTKRITCLDDIQGWQDLQNPLLAELKSKIEELNNLKGTPQPKLVQNKPIAKGYPFKDFRHLVAEVTNVSAYGEKTELIRAKLISIHEIQDVILWCRLLLPSVNGRIYNLQNKQLLKLFSRLFKTPADQMLSDLQNCGDISQTVSNFFAQSQSELQPTNKSTLLLSDIDQRLERLAVLTKEDEQMDFLRDFVAQCTANDLKVFVRLIKHDLRMNCGAKHVLNAIHPNAYEIFQSTQNLSSVIEKCRGDKKVTSSPTGKKAVALNAIEIMTPILPMLAEICRSKEQAFRRCPNGMYAEIKYDGERLQLHKKGTTFHYFSRSLKHVQAHKVNYLSEHIPKAFPDGDSLILDCEMLLIDQITSKPLPFGTLGVHKQTQFKNANVCLFVFDCIFYNGKSLVSVPLKERKAILDRVMRPIPNRIIRSEMHLVNGSQHLQSLIDRAFADGLEGLVLKDIESIYEPGKRRWLKVKRDHLDGGAMADCADLIVLGAWFGTGKLGGKMSTFLMGCYDEDVGVFRTVCKVHQGLDEDTIGRLQTNLKMKQIYGELEVPTWLNCAKRMIPDFVACDPWAQPVWQIAGAEFTQNEVHTADGISIRFPRISRFRDDKDAHSATTFEELKVLVSGGETKTNVNVKQTELSPTDISYEDCMREIRNPLPDFFGGVVCCLRNKGDYLDDNCERYLQAYGGEFVRKKRKSCTRLTHVLHLDYTITCAIPWTGPKRVKHVHVDWIRRSIECDKLLDTVPFTVQWLPQ